MPTYGLQIKNSSGNIIIDEINKNYSLYTSGNITMSGIGTFDTISFTATNQMPLIAIKPISGYEVILWGIKKTGSNYDGFYISGTSGQNLDYRIYTAYVASSDIYGLRVMDASEVTIFDSGMEHFNIYSSSIGISLSTPTNIDEASGTYFDISHDDISPYYFLSPTGFWGYSVYYPGPDMWRLFIWRPGIKKNSATSVRVKWIMLKYITAGGFVNQGSNPNYNLLILK